MIRKRAVVYGRVSTDKKEQEQSLDVQTISMEDQCVKMGFKLEKTYAEKGTATSVRHRNKFLKMMENCGLDFKRIQEGTDYFIQTDREPLYDVIFVKEVSRISRHTQQGLDIVARLKEKKVDIYLANTGKYISELDVFTLTILFSSAQNESQSTSDRIKYSKRKIAESGIFRPSKLAYGYMKQYHDKSLKTYDVVINPKEEKIVEEIFDMYINKNYGTIKIANALNEKGIQSRGGKRGWSDDKIKRVIMNPIYHGTPVMHNRTKENGVTDNYYKLVEGNSIPLSNVVESIISKDTFDKAQEVRASRIEKHGKRGIHKSKDNTYKSKVRCLQCGGVYVKFTNSGDVISYNCGNQRKYGKSQCDSRGIRITQLNKYLYASEIHLDYSTYETDYKWLQDEFESAYKQQKALTEMKQQKISEIDSELKLTLNAIKREADEDILEGFRAEYSELKEQKELTQREIVRINTDSLKTLAKRVKEKYESLKVIEQKANDTYELKERIEVIKVIEVGKAGIKVAYNTPSFADEIHEFNEMFKDTDIQIDWFSPEYEELCYRYYRHQGKNAIRLEDYLRETNWKIDESDKGLSKLIEELREIHMEDQANNYLDAMSSN